MNFALWGGIVVVWVDRIHYRTTGLRLRSFGSGTRTSVQRFGALCDAVPKIRKVIQY